MPRVVSLHPAATEIVCLLGARADLVGRSHECDFPPDVRALPPLTTPAELGRAIDTELLDRLAPDVILTRGPSGTGPRPVSSVVPKDQSHRPEADPTVSLNPTTLEGVLDDILTVGRAIARESQARDAVVRLRERLYAALDHVPSFEEGPTVAFLEWTDPLHVAGLWTPQLIERAGGRHPLNPTRAPPEAGAAIGPQAAFRRAGPGVRVPDDVFAATRPDAIIICPRGLDLGQARRGAHELARKPWWPDLPAVRGRRVALVDGHQMFHRPGPRLIDAFEWLVSWLQRRPDLTPPGFPWEAFPPRQ
ncbi:MAG: hypothetical protein FJ255_03515 [Phycisphaerae bacterium]|nr:hypothetical protein [Phycisphaerae bacterium]